MKFINASYVINLAKKLINKKIIIALVVIFIVYIVGNRNAQNVSQIKFYKVAPKTIESSVTSSGKIQAEQSTNLHFQTSGQIAWINAKQGQSVQKGEAIASLNTQTLQKQLKSDLNTYAKTRTTFDDTNYTYKDQPLTDAIKRIAQRSQLDLENSVVDVEIRDLAIRFATITSPIDGHIVSDPSVYTGSNVLATDTIATVASSSNLQLMAEVDETDIGKARLGQKANITLDAFPDKTFSSTVSQIAPQAITTSTGATAFNVTFNMESSEPFLIGMNGSAQIITATKENVLSVPLEAIVNDNFVWIKKGKNYQQREVTKGLESDSDVEITSGISEGDNVVTAGFDQLQKASLFQKIIGSVL